MNKFFSLLMAAYLICSGLSFFAHAASTNRIIATVNGKMITSFELDSAVKPELLQHPNQDADTLKRKILDELILDILLADDAKRLGISVEDSEVEQEILGMMKMRNVSKAAFEKQLAKEGLTPDLLRTKIKNGLLRQRLLGRQVARKVVVSPEQIRAYYEEHRSSFLTGGGANIELIIYPPKENAEKWASQIRSGKISFEDAVRRVSIGPNKEQGGRIGIPQGKIPAEIAKRIPSMQPGSVSDIFSLQGHKAQFKFFGVASGGEQLSLEEATPQIDAILREPKSKILFDEYIKQLRTKAVIDIKL